MPGPTKRRKYHQGITTEKKKYRTKRRRRDIDLIVEDLDKPQRKRPLDLDLPGGGQFYCVHCAKDYINEQALAEHKRGKVHKKRVKDTEEVPYSIEESERAGGLGTYQAPAAKRPKPELMEEEGVQEVVQ